MWASCFPYELSLSRVQRIERAESGQVKGHASGWYWLLRWSAALHLRMSAPKVLSM